MLDIAYIIFATFIIIGAVFFIDHLRIVFRHDLPEKNELDIATLLRAQLEKNNVSFSINQSRINRK